MRVFLDTNMLVSALATRGLCAELLTRMVKRKLVLVTGDAVIDEFHRVLSDKFHTRLDELPFTCEFLERLEIAPGPGEIPASVLEIPDPDDIPIVACALASGAKFFITGDKVLLELGEIEGMTIVSPREAWEILAKMD